MGGPIVPQCRPPDFSPTYAMGAVSGSFHVFLSHVWGTGQDQMRIVKQRLLEMLPDLKCFLDVDDLEEIGNLGAYIKASNMVLLFLSKGYWFSASAPACRTNPQSLWQPRLA